MRFTQKQIYEVLGQVVSKPDGLGELLKVGLELLMKSESQIHNEEYSDSSNGCRKRIFKYNPAIAFWFNVLMF